MTGVKLIAQERHRQIAHEGYTAEHDRRHCDGSLAIAGAWYALPSDNRVRLPWPWDKIFCKPTPDNRIRELVKAGALIAAEIDRLEHARKAVEKA